MNDEHRRKKTGEKNEDFFIFFFRFERAQTLKTNEQRKGKFDRRKKLQILTEQD